MNDHVPMDRRTFVTELLAVGGGFVAGVAWLCLGQAPTVDAAEPGPGTKTPATPAVGASPGRTRPAPREKDHRPIRGKVPAPPSPRPSPTPRRPPAETDRHPLPGDVAPPPSTIPTPRPKPPKS